MVRARRGPRDRGAAGEIAGDPSLATAAVAFTLGFHDILGFLSLPLADEAIVIEVLSQVATLQGERRADEREDLARRLARLFR